MSSSPHSAFTFIRRVPISALNITLEEYHHQATGALHYHLSAENNENVFLVALRTVPMDNKGVAHILEHTALCGSERYPVRDPFFMMIRRSLNTFMNAFTSNDWTAYPFASQNKKDFNNLLDVYLDAVFFSRLDELDFMQEGHRLEFSESNNSESELVYKGVVYNEMKGAMSSINSVLWQTLCKYLFPSTTYHYNSGGDPEYITDLSYQELRAFYQQHYHPSNAIFLTFGDIPAAEHQAIFEEKALSRFSQGDNTITIDREKRYHAPLRIEEDYAFDSDEPLEAQTHIILSWLLGESTQLSDVLEAQLLSYILLENSACPLQAYLESTPLGSAPSALTGLEDSYREMVFSCGISGAEAENADEFEKDVLQIITQTAEEGIAPERLDAILHQIELSHREISGDGYPYGLQLILAALTSATHRGDPVDLLDLAPAIAHLKSLAQSPDFVSTLLHKWLLDNPHRIRLVMRPNKDISARKLQAEKAQLNAIKSALSESEKQAIIEKTQALEARQANTDNADILPKVGLEDIPSALAIAQGEVETTHGIASHFYAQGTNGLVYQQLILPLPALPDHLVALLPLYTRCLTDVGIGEETFADIQHRQSACVGSIHAFTSLQASLDSEQEIPAYLMISAKALASKQQAMAELLKDTLENARFDELDRISDIVSQTVNRREQGITGNGHAYAMTAACAKLSPMGALSEQWSGLSALKDLKALHKQMNQQTDAVKQLAENLHSIHLAVQTANITVLSIAEREQQASLQQTINALWPAQKPVNFSFATQHTREHQQVAWLCNSQVNFCAKAFATVAQAHPDSAPLIVLGGFLRNGYLHTAIREKGGAYGAGASQDNNSACFRFYSYRDPRISGTLNDFDAAVEWLLNTEHRPEQLEEAILGVIASMDKPASPAGEAKRDFQQTLFGRTAQQRQAYREQLLAVRLEDLQRVARCYLLDQEASVAVVSHEGAREELEMLGLEIHRLS